MKTQKIQIKIDGARIQDEMNCAMTNIASPEELELFRRSWLNFRQVLKDGNTFYFMSSHGPISLPPRIVDSTLEEQEA